MTDTEGIMYSFNLWDQPWVGLEHQSGAIELHGIEQTLLRAHEFRSIFDPSPLVVVGVHRLLTTILQDLFEPKTEEELRRLWELQQIPQERISEFGLKYAARFDLFSKETPFYQSVDVSPVPIKGEKTKSIAYLSPDIPSGTEHTHYRHGAQTDQVFCPACVAAGMVTLPAFSTSGGAGIKPSINGVPPTYVIPIGGNLLQSLLLSLVLPKYQPVAQATDIDLVWWRRTPIVPKSSDAVSVGYLHSLTFQPRRVRLYPEVVDDNCSRCGQPTHIGVRMMIFDMGESRPKEAATWFDPFAAYKLPKNKPPIPIRPVEGKAMWREYGNLFLKKGMGDASMEKTDSTLRPSFLDQISDLREGDTSVLALRCVGLRTDMKAKVFEWVDSGFEVPGALLKDEVAAYLIDKAVGYASSCARIISNAFRKAFGGSGENAARYEQLIRVMLDGYWRQLALPFRKLYISLSETGHSPDAYKEWVDGVTRVAKSSFIEAASNIGMSGDQLHKRYRGERDCSISLYSAQKKELNDE